VTVFDDGVRLRDRLARVRRRWVAGWTVALLVGSALAGLVWRVPRPQVLQVNGDAAWLLSSAVGLVSHANGLSAAVDLEIRLPVGMRGHRLAVAESRGREFVIDRDTGSVSVLDETTLQVAPSAFRLGPGESLVAFPAGRDAEVYVVDGAAGAAWQMDAHTLRRGQTLALGEPVAGLGYLGNCVAAVGATVVAVTRGCGSDWGQAQSLELGARLADVVVGTAGAGVVLPLVVPEQHVLVLADVGRGSVERVSLAPLTRSRHFGPPVVLDGRVYVPDQDTGKLIVYDLAFRRFRPPVRVTGGPAALDVFVSDDMVWANNPGGPDAAVIYHGLVRKFRKYQLAPNQHPPAAGPLRSAPRAVSAHTPDVARGPQTRRPRHGPGSDSGPSHTGGPLGQHLAGARPGDADEPGPGSEPGAGTEPGPGSDPPGGRTQDPPPSDALGPPTLVSTAQSDAFLPVFGPTGRFLALHFGTGGLGPDAPVLLMDAADPAHLVQLAAIPDGAGLGRPAFSADSQLLVVSGTPAVTVWDVADPRHPSQLASLPDSADASRVDTVFSLAGPVLATGGSAEVILWNLSDPRRPVRYSALPEPAGATPVAFSPDGRMLAVKNQDDSLALWNVAHPADPRRVRQIPGLGSASLDQEWHTAATSSSSGMVLWDITDPANPIRRGVIPIRSGCTTCMWAAPPQFSRDGRILALFSGAQGVGNLPTGLSLADVSDTRNPVVYATLMIADRTPSSVGNAVSFSPDNRTMAYGRVWDGSPEPHTHHSGIDVYELHP
jgi:hypothetical protein